MTAAAELRCAATAREYWHARFRGHDVDAASLLAYFAAEKRLRTNSPARSAARRRRGCPWRRRRGGVAGLSETDGFSGGLAAACLVSGFAVAASARCGVRLRLASTAFGFAGAAGGGALAVVSAAPPRPTLRARLLKKPSDGVARRRRRDPRRRAPALAPSRPRRLVRRRHGRVRRIDVAREWCRARATARAATGPGLRRLPTARYRRWAAWRRTPCSCRRRCRY